MYMGTKHTLKEIEEATLRDHRERIERGEKLDFVEFVLYQELKEKNRQYKMIIDNNDFYQVGYKRGQYDERQKVEKELFNKNTELEIKEFKRTELEQQNKNLQEMLNAERELKINDDYLKGIAERDSIIEQAKEIIKRQLKIIDDVCDISMLGDFAKETIKKSEDYIKVE